MGYLLFVSAGCLVAVYEFDTCGFLCEHVFNLMLSNRLTSAGATTATQIASGEAKQKKNGST